MRNPETPDFGQTQANLLLEKGWAQGRIFTPDEVIKVPEAGVIYVVCTQSCSVVSESLEKDPIVELAEARPLPKYAPKSDEARGKNVRRYHLPVEGTNFSALQVDINRRCFVDRRLLLDRIPGAGSISQKARRDFSAWLGRYYARIDLPNAFVSRFKEHFRPGLESFLRGIGAADTVPRHERIESLWVKYSPDEELGEENSYNAEFIFMCENPAIAQWMDRDLIALLGEGELTRPGLKVKFSLNSPQETILSDLHDFHRFTDWDHLSGPWAAAAGNKAT